MLRLKQLGLAVATTLCTTAFAADWPAQPIQLIVPFPAGGAVDAVARAFAEAMSAELPQRLLVMNRDGAGGSIGTGAMVGSAPDGYTLALMPSGPLTVQPTLNRKVSYTMNSVKPVCKLFAVPYVLAVPNDSRFGSLKDYMAAAKAAPQPVMAGVGGIGTAPHFIVLQLAQAAKTKIQSVAYRGDPPVALAIKGKEIDAAVLTAAIAKQQGFKLLAVFSERRLAAFPGIATAKEQGFDISGSAQGGLIAPAAVPPAVISKLEASCAAVVRKPAFRSTLQNLVHEVDFQPSAQFEASLRAETEIKRRLIEQTGMRNEQ